MKRMSLLVCGIAVSSLIATVQAQHAPRDWNSQLEGPAGQQPSQHTDSSHRQVKPPVPRGNLRGDIASSARSRTESHTENPRQP